MLAVISSWSSTHFLLIKIPGLTAKARVYMYPANVLPHYGLYSKVSLRKDTGWLATFNKATLHWGRGIPVYHRLGVFGNVYCTCPPIIDYFIYYYYYWLTLFSLSFSLSSRVRCLVQLIDLSNKSIDEALRSFQLLFRMPVSNNNYNNYF